VREHARFTFCSSLTPGPFKVSVVESRGFAHHAARAPGAPRFVQRGRFALRLERRYPVDVPQCRELSYSWRPKRVMFLPGARALDVTIAFPRAVGPWPIELSDHETVFR